MPLSPVLGTGVARDGESASEEPFTEESSAEEPPFTTEEPSSGVSVSELAAVCEGVNSGGFGHGGITVL